jgi:glycosyltransferase involved in cell wall biosynthesis
MNKNRKISIVLPSYNREQYISVAIESCIAQTFKDFELIIVDDCSKDSSVEIARNYAKKDSRTKTS